MSEDYIVTHNSVISAFSLNTINQVHMLYIKPGYIEKWVGTDEKPGDIGKVLNITRDQICVIFGSSRLKKVMEK